MKPALLRSPRLVCLLGLALCGAVTIHAQNFALNGSFEDPGALSNDAGDGFVDGFDSIPAGGTSITGWTVITHEIARGIRNDAYIVASEGSFFLDLTGYMGSGAGSGGVSQTITTTPGATYRFAFDLGTLQGDSNSDGPISVTASAAGLSPSFTHDPGGIGNQWANYGFDFVAASASTEISILGTGGKYYIGLDNVSVTAVSPVPEPGHYAAIAGLALVAFGGWRRCRR